MKKALIVIDMQNDFIDGVLGTPEARAIVENVADKILDFEGDIFVTQDIHGKDYLNTQEGKMLPIEHCIRETYGSYIHEMIADALSKHKQYNLSYKSYFSCFSLAKELTFNEYREIHMVGLCTNICVVSNVFLIKGFNPEARIIVDASCCAGTSPEMHEKALDVMQSCHIIIENR